MATLRVCELQRLFLDNYQGQPLADDDSGLQDLWIMANHMAGHPGNEQKSRARIVSWCKTWAPWLPADAARALADKAIAKRLKWGADKLGRLLGVTMEQRTRLRIQTIGSFEMTKAERAAAQIEKRRNRDHARRRAKGSISRADYEDRSLSKARPWKALGMSRAAWYRAGRPGHNWA
jgi:hypothetical protein